MSEVGRYRYVVIGDRFSWQYQLDETRDEDVLRQEFLITTKNGPKSFFLKVANGTSNHILEKYIGSNWELFPTEAIIFADNERITVSLSKIPKLILNRPGDWVEETSGKIMEMNGLTMFVYKDSSQITSRDFTKSPDGKVLNGGFQTECGYVVDRYFLVE